ARGDGASGLRVAGALDVEGGDGWQRHRAGVGEAPQVLELHDRERRLAEAEHQRPALLERDGAGAVDERRSHAGGERAQRRRAARQHHGAGEAVGAGADRRVELAVAVDLDFGGPIDRQRRRGDEAARARRIAQLVAQHLARAGRGDEVDALDGGRAGERAQQVHRQAHPRGAGHQQGDARPPAARPAAHGGDNMAREDFMAPWWSRPTAEGSEQGPERETESAVPAPPASEPVQVEPPPRLAPPPEPLGSPVAPAPPPVEAPALTGEGEELPGGDETEGAGEAPHAAAELASPERRRRRRNGRGRGGGSATAAAAEARTSEPRPADEPRPAPEPPRPRPLREPPPPPRREEPPGDRIHLGVPQLQELIREIVTAVPERTASSYEERKLAVFCDLENVAIGSRDSGVNFDVNLVLERLLEKGKIIVKKAYADWSRYADYKRPFHEAGIELIDI